LVCFENKRKRDSRECLFFFFFVFLRERKRAFQEREMREAMPWVYKNWRMAITIPFRKVLG